MFLKKREREEDEEKKKPSKPPETAGLAGQESVPALPLLFNPFPSWVGQAGREGLLEASLCLCVPKRICSLV